MSETPETSQSATGPCVAMADTGLALTAWTAVFREAVLVKVPGGDGGGGAGGGSIGGHRLVSSVWLVAELHRKHGVTTLVSPPATHSLLT
eukprot:scaffold22650_cov55-Phaeocystis_antarctica.AAC.6